MWIGVFGYESLYEINTESKIIRRKSSGREVVVNSGGVMLSKNGESKRLLYKDVIANSITEERVEREKEKSKECDALFPVLDMFENGWKNDGAIGLLRGDLGEHLVCVELLSRGIRCGMNVFQGAPYDVVGDFGNGNIFKVQVKSRTGKRNRNGSYDFGCEIAQLAVCDVMAHVGLDIRTVLFCLTSEIKSASLRANRAKLRALADGSIDRVLDALHKRLINKG